MPRTDIVLVCKISHSIYYYGYMECDTLLIFLPTIKLPFPAMQTTRDLGKSNFIRPSFGL